MGQEEEAEHQVWTLVFLEVPEGKLEARLKGWWEGQEKTPNCGTGCLSGSSETRQVQERDEKSWVRVHKQGITQEHF